MIMHRTRTRAAKFDRLSVLRMRNLATHLSTGLDIILSQDI